MARPTENWFSILTFIAFIVMQMFGCGASAGVQCRPARVMYGRMREGATPVRNAVSLFLMVASALLALTLVRGAKSR